MKISYTYGNFIAVIDYYSITFLFGNFIAVIDYWSIMCLFKVTNNGQQIVNHTYIFY